MKQCFYEVLGVAPNASGEDIKRAYRVQALKHHPDKNPDNEDAARSCFQLVQEAYETLSDPQERSWYDSHKIAILRGEEDPAACSGEDPAAARINIFNWFRRGAFDSFEDNDKNGFYQVYSRVFAIIAEEEVLRSERGGTTCDSFRNAPPFGNSSTEIKSVLAFYRFWASFQSQRNFSFADEWRPSDGPTRFARRAIAAENAKKRQAAKREFSDAVSELANFVKRRDPRWAAYLRDVAAEKVAKIERQRRIAEIQREKAALQREQLRAEEQQRMEARLKALEEKKRAMAAESNEEDLDDGTKVQSPVGSDAGEGSVSESSASEHVEIFCEACKKTFKSDPQWKQHERSRKHKTNVLAFVRKMSQNDADKV